MIETQDWEFLSGPIRINQDKLRVCLGDSSGFILCYTLQTLELMTDDHEVRKKIKERWERAFEKNPKIRPGLKFRLASKPKEDYTEGLIERYEGRIDVIGLELRLGITDYGVFAATNGAAKEDPEFARFLMEKGKEFFKNEYIYFASPIGNCAVVEFSDGKIPLIKRSNLVYEYPGFYDTPGGHPEPTQHTFDAKGQFDAIKDEVSEELGIPKESIEEAHLLGVVINKRNFGKPDLLFHLRTGLSSDKMNPNYEVSGLEKLTKDQLFENLKKENFKTVPPSQALITAYFSLQKGYNL